MSKTLCKGIRKDGSPCQGNGLDQYDGYCIAHAPSDVTREWRSRGGKNSATAVRLDKRIPEDLKKAVDLVQDSMIQVREGKMSPAACNAICRGAQTLIGLRRRSDEEMDLIRTEEIQAAAAEFLGLHSNLDVLEAADDMSARQDQYRAEALVDQGYAEVKEPFDPEAAPEITLNDKGRRRFGYHTLDATQQLLIGIEEELTEPDYRPSGPPDIPEITDLLQTLQEDVEEALSALARDDVAPFDPLTGKAITELPVGVRTRSKLNRLFHDEVQPREHLEEQLGKIQQLMRVAEELSQAEEPSQERELSQAEEFSQNEDDEQEPGEADEDEKQELKVVVESDKKELEETDEIEKQKLEEAQHNRNTIEYLKKSLKARGVPVETLPPHLRWQ